MSNYRSQFFGLKNMANNVLNHKNLLRFVDVTNEVDSMTFRLKQEIADHQSVPESNCYFTLSVIGESVAIEDANSFVNLTNLAKLDGECSVNRNSQRVADELQRSFWAKIDVWQNACLGYLVDRIDSIVRN